MLQLAGANWDDQHNKILLDNLTALPPDWLGGGPERKAASNQNLMVKPNDEDARGYLLGFIQSRNADDKGREGLELFAALDRQRDCLVLSGNLGEPPPGTTGRLYPLLLRTSDLWQQTGGIRFGLFGTGGAVSLLWDLPYGALDAHKLAAAVMGFAERIMLWRQVVASALSEAPADPAAAQLEQTALKV